MVSMVPLLAYPDNDRFPPHRVRHLQAVQPVQRRALVLAIRLANQMELIEDIFYSTDDKSVRRQMAFILGRQRICLDLSQETKDEDSSLEMCLNNVFIHDYFRNSLAKELLQRAGAEDTGRHLQDPPGELAHHGPLRTRTRAKDTTSPARL